MASSWSPNQPEKNQEILQAIDDERSRNTSSMEESSSASVNLEPEHDASSMAAPSNNEREVNQESWQACAGSLADIPKKDSLVYYFPQGHMVLVFVVWRTFHFLLILKLIKSLLSFFFTQSQSQTPSQSQTQTRSQSQTQTPSYYINLNRIFSSPFTIPNDDFVSYITVLTKTNDFVPLRKYIFSMIPQTLSNEILFFTDIHGKIWKITFETIKFTISKILLPALTDGWIDFVKAKNLTAGDSIVFMLKKSTLQYYIGIRRAVVNTKIGPKDVEDAIQRARDMKSFEVVYYPNLDLPEFVVPKEKVDAALHVPWTRERPVKIAYDDTTIPMPRKFWHCGRLLNDIDRKNNMINSLDYWWRVLQVQWDVTPEVLQEKAYLQKNMSPW